MNEILDFMERHWTDLIALVTAAGSLVIGITSAVRSHKLSKALDDAKRRQTTIVCPHCHKESPLSEVNFRLPGGEIDNNLDGIPD